MAWVLPLIGKSRLQRKIYSEVCSQCDNSTLKCVKAAFLKCQKFATSFSTLQFEVQTICVKKKNM
jgi:hypothetical protein